DRVLRSPEGFHGFGQRPRLARGDAHLGPLGHQALRYGHPASPAGSGDVRRLAVESLAHVLPLRLQLPMAATRAVSPRWRRRILPVVVFGSSSRISTLRGYL